MQICTIMSNFFRLPFCRYLLKNYYSVFKFLVLYDKRMGLGKKIAEWGLLPAPCLAYVNYV